MSAIISLLSIYRYAIITPLAVVQGPLVALVAGFVVRFGPLDFIPTYFALMAGDLIGDVIYYWLGYRYGERFISKYGKYVSVTDRNVAVVKKMFDKYHSKILVISKLTTGFGFAPLVLFTAGMSRVSFAKYMTINIVGQFFWTALLVGIGYYLGNFYVTANNFLEEVAVTAVLVVLCVGVVGFAKYLRDRTVEKYSK